MKPEVPRRAQAVEAAEIAVSTRERAVELRELAVAKRDEAAAVREADVTAHEAGAKARVNIEAHGIKLLREANQNLVAAALKAQRLTETAELSNRQQEEFLAMLAHELRGPLSPIRNAVAILQRLVKAHPQLPWIHDLLKRQTEQMTRLLDDLLDVARVTGGKVSLHRRAVLCTEFIGQAVETCRPLIDSRRQQLTLDISAHPICVDGDLSRLTQVTTNLLNNASKYTDPGGAISVSVQSRGAEVDVKIKDNGSGIPPETLPHVFDLFVQSDRALARAQGGLGIGLTVVRRLVEMHGGTVSAFSAGTDQGSEFVVTLPVFEALPVAALAEKPQFAVERQYRIVLIEDNVDTNQATTTLLQMMGHKVLSSFDGIAGVNLVLSSRPQVVLCDVGLPGLDGYGVVRKLKDQVQGPMPCMIALTGYGRPEDREAALNAGFDIHLVKPVDPEILMQSIVDFFEPAARTTQS
jgi:signal transduction histidine kinase/ActR/RegA family two-component response regulator